MESHHRERVFVGLIIALFVLLGATLNHFDAWPFTIGYSESDARSPRAQNKNRQDTVSIALVGDPEMVFDYSVQKCDTNDIPDLAVRAFRDAKGQVHLIRSHYSGNRSMIGSSLDTVQNNCAINFASANDTSFDNRKYHEWIASPYTIDGTTVYSLVHNEWYGWLADTECIRGNQIHGWINSLTLAVSSNGGSTYQHPTDYKIRYPTTPWSTSFGCTSTDHTQYGSFTPSNIVKATDGYFYALFWSIKSQYETQGSCLMRTGNLANASSWEVYTDNGFVKSKTAVCEPVIPLNIVMDSLTYNTALGKYVGVGLNFSKQEFSLLTSSDLINWSSPQKIMSVPKSADGWWTRAYPSLLDPLSASRNFETTGQESYLYFMEHHGGLDRDLMRQKISLTPNTR
ncbi:MAG: hypothetical protein AAB420_01585 [Patescibacteria group bacterium]